MFCKDILGDSRRSRRSPATKARQRAAKYAARAPLWRRRQPAFLRSGFALADQLLTEKWAAGPAFRRFFPRRLAPAALRRIPKDRHSGGADLGGGSEHDAAQSTSQAAISRTSEKAPPPQRRRTRRNQQCNLHRPDLAVSRRTPPNPPFPPGHGAAAAAQPVSSTPHDGAAGLPHAGSRVHRAQFLAGGEHFLLAGGTPRCAAESILLQLVAPAPPGARRPTLRLALHPLAKVRRCVPLPRDARTRGTVSLSVPGLTREV